MLGFVTLTRAIANFNDPHEYPNSSLTWYWKQRDYSNPLTNAVFDIRYKGGKTTQNYYGWNVQFSQDGNLRPLSGSYEGKFPPISRSGRRYVEFSTEITRPIGPDYLLISFKVFNNQLEPATINITIWADVMILNNDKATVEWYGKPDRRGITMTDPPTNTKLTLVARNGYSVEDVDTFWFGQFVNYSDFHEFDVYDGDAPLENTDSAFSFGWKNRVIYPNATQYYSVLFGVGVDLKDPPIVNVNTQFKDNYKGGDKIKVEGRVIDYTYNESLNLYILFNNGTVNETIPFPMVENGNINKTFEKEITLPSELGKYVLEIYAVDDYGLKSNLFSRYLLVNEPPTIQVTRDVIKPKYVTGSAVEIVGTLWDDRKASVHYRFDTDYNFSVPELFECNGQEVGFRVTFPLRESRLNIGDHELYVWAEDDFGAKSPIQGPFKFRYEERHAPKITIENSEVKHHTIGEYIMINGAVQDQDPGETITIWYKAPNQGPQESFREASPINLSYILSDDTPVKFAFIVKIERDFETDKEIKFIVKARDSYNTESFDANYVFIADKIKAPVVTEPPQFKYPPNYLAPGSEKKPNYYVFTSTFPSYSKTDASVGQGEETYSTWTVTSTVLTLQSENPQRTPEPSTVPPATQTPEPAFVPSGVKQEGNEFINIADPKKKKDNEKFQWLPIVLGAAGVALLAIIIAVIIIVIEARKKAKEYNFDMEEAGTYQDEIDIAIENENELYNKGYVDDPWAQDFDEDQEHMFPQK